MSFRRDDGLWDMSSDLAIEASGLVKMFGDTRAVAGVDLTVRRGAVYGVNTDMTRASSTASAHCRSGVRPYRTRD